MNVIENLKSCYSIISHFVDFVWNALAIASGFFPPVILATFGLFIVIAGGIFFVNVVKTISKIINALLLFYLGL